MFGAVALTETTAQAQSWRRYDGNRGRVGIQRRGYYPRRRWYWHNRYDWWYGGYPYNYYPGYYFSSSHITEGQGYRDGLDDGKDDVKDGKAFDPYRHKDYKNGVTSAYLSAYLRGYEEGYGRTER
jgi:hypothetical protein